MSTNLTIFGNNYTDVAGIKAEDSNGVIHTFTEGGGSTLPVTGTFTPTSNSSSITIDTGLDEINGYLIIPTANPYVGSTLAIYAVFGEPDGSWIKQMTVRGQGTSGRGFELWITTTPPHTISGGIITISYNYPANTGYFTPVTYKWFAW